MGKLPVLSMDMFNSDVSHYQRLNSTIQLLSPFGLLVSGPQGHHFAQVLGPRPTETFHVGRWTLVDPAPTKALHARGRSASPAYTGGAPHGYVAQRQLQLGICCGVLRNSGNPLVFAMIP